jgi:hypothetical protein
MSDLPHAGCADLLSDKMLYGMIAAQVWIFVEKGDCI